MANRKGRTNRTNGIESNKCCDAVERAGGMNNIGNNTSSDIRYHLLSICYIICVLCQVL